MGMPDTVTKEYMSDNNHFADLFNYYMNICTGSKLKLNEEGGPVKMCEAWRQYGEEKEKIGENKAFVKNVENVAESFHISIEEACEILKKDYETYLKIKETL
jgi:hypothetical protein